MNFFSRKKINLKLIGKNSIFIDKTVKLGKNVTIYPNNIIKGNTVIGDNVTLLSNNYISNTTIGDNTQIEQSHIEDSVIEKACVIGPFSRLRPHSHIGEKCKVGNFVEVKNASLGKNTKASHLSYIGDAEIGDNCNIGCGAIFVNYNGKEKNRSIVGNNCFIGSNCNVIAPVNIADDTYVCAGSTITINTEPEDFVIARCRETIKHKYSGKYRKGEK